MAITPFRVPRTAPGRGGIGHAPTEVDVLTALRIRRAAESQSAAGQRRAIAILSDLPLACGARGLFRRRTVIQAAAQVNYPR